MSTDATTLWVATTAAVPTAGATFPRSRPVTPRRSSDPLVIWTARSSPLVSARTAETARHACRVAWAVLTGSVVGGTIGAALGTIAGHVLR